MSYRFLRNVFQLAVVFAVAASAFPQQRRPVESAVYRKPLRSSVANEITAPGLRNDLPKSAEIPLAALVSSDLANLELRPGTESIGVHRSLVKSALRYGADRNGGMKMDGAWTKTPDGEAVWRLMIRSEGAAGIRVHFTGFSVGAGRVWVYGGDEPSAAGKLFQELGPWGDGEFWSQVVFSDTVQIEYEPENAAVGGGDVPFQVEEISHLWRTPGMRERPGVLPPPPLPASPETSPAALRQPGRLPPSSVTTSGEVLPEAEREAALTPVPQAGYCQLDSSCYPEWEETAKSVALIFIETNSGSASCSGTLLNTRNQSFTPYFLTASHCVESASLARTVEAFWFFQSSACNGTPPKPYQVPSVLGARQVKRFGDFNSSQGDFNLLVLEDVPGGVVFSGWDPNPVPVGASTASIHHPDSEYKRITFGRTVRDTWYGASDAYMIVDETSGRTESGSSGSGLFTSPNTLVGALSFGPALQFGRTACDTNPYFSGYGRFSELYPEISDFLEDTLPPPPGDDDPLESGVARDFELPPVFFPTLFDEPVFNVVVPENAVGLRIEMDATESGSDVDMYVRYGQPPVLSGGEVIADFASESPTASETIVISGGTSPALRTGNYYIGFVQWSRFLAVSGSVTATVDAVDFRPEGPPGLAAVVHGATQLTGGVAPGEIVTLYGSDLGPAWGTQPRLTSEGRVPTTAEGVQVLFDGVPAPLFYLGPGQINAQAPYEIAGSQTVGVQVLHSGGASAALPVPVSGSAPGIFMYLDGSGRAVAINQDGNINSPENPESRNRIVVMYATGEGLTTPQAETGVPVANQLPLPVPLLPVTVQIGGIDAEVLFAGSPVGFSGLMQVNVRIPLEAPAGAVPVALKVGEAASAADVTISVQ